MNAFCHKYFPKNRHYLIVAANKNLASSDKRNSQRLKSIKQQTYIIQANIQRHHDKKATSTNYLHRTYIFYNSCTFCGGSLKFCELV